MGSLQNLDYALTHWSFGITILVGLVASKFSGAETVVAILVAALSSTLSAICGVSSNSSEEQQFKRKKLGNHLNFLIIWLDVLTNLVAASTCARLTSATIDYISKGHFREFLFGLEQHSLGEPWPDVLGVTIVVVVTILFMMGLEKSPAISALLFLALLGHFVFFTIIGSFHTINQFSKWCEKFKVHSFIKVLEAGAILSYAFVHDVPKTPKNNCLKMFTLVFNPVVFYTVTAIIFSLMTRYRELSDTAIPLIQVFENRDVDWARPLIAAFTICVVCFTLTEVMPRLYFAFVKLSGKEWQIFVRSIQYQSATTGAPVLAIFAAGSLAAILAFACPLLHLIKLLNTSCLLRCVINSCQIVYNRYRPELHYNECLVYNTNVHYSKLNQNNTKSTSACKPSIKDKISNLLGTKSGYIHRLSSPKVPKNSMPNIRVNYLTEERECLLLDDYSNKSVNIELEEETASENDENEINSLSDDDDSGSSTDIDLIVEEYREGLKVTTVGNFKETQPSTKMTSIVVICCLIIIITSSILIALYLFKIVHVYWPNLLGLMVSAIIITIMPQNSSEKAKEVLLPTFLFATFHTILILLNIVLFSTIIAEVWQGIVFWTLAGLILFWRCDCCACDDLAAIKDDKRILTVPQEIIYEYKDNNTSDTIYISR